jgi:hypothetical protein
MKEEFQLPVIYNGKQYHFAARLIQFGYLHKFQVNVEGVEVFFERDEERNYRAFVDPINGEAINKVNLQLLEQIALAIESIGD